jgi:hypothetical protein
MLVAACGGSSRGLTVMKLISVSAWATLLAWMAVPAWADTFTVLDIPFARFGTIDIATTGMAGTASTWLVYRDVTYDYNSAVISGQINVFGLDQQGVPEWILGGTGRNEFFGTGLNNFFASDLQMGVLVMHITPEMGGIRIFERDMEAFSFNNIYDGITRSGVQFTQHLMLQYDNGLLIAPSNAIVVTPLPAALPLFATSLGVLGLLGWRKKKSQALATTA